MHSHKIAPTNVVGREKEKERGGEREVLSVNKRARELDGVLKTER